MEYTKCSKTEAIKALRETNDDSVNAIMKLTKWLFINFYGLPESINKNYTNHIWAKPKHPKHTFICNQSIHFIQSSLLFKTHNKMINIENGINLPKDPRNNIEGTMA